MLDSTSIKIKFYKCFGANAQGFNKIFPFNIIIGKNNAGKSSLIELIEYVVGLGGNGNKQSVLSKLEQNSKIVINKPIEIGEISSTTFNANVRNAQARSAGFGNNFEYGKTWVGSNVTYEISKEAKKELVEFQKKFDLEERAISESFLNDIQFPIRGKVFKKISSERDVVPETSGSPFLLSNGQGTTNLIREFIHSIKYDSRLVERDLLRELNKIINPDIEFSKILVQEDGQKQWEIYFESKSEIVVPLSKMGSGIKTILLVLVTLYLIPHYENAKIKNYIFAFEELENNLHPSLQRRLLNYLISFGAENNVIFFLTTHSSVFIDIFNKDDKSQIVHLLQIGEEQIANDVINYSSTKNILNDLDVRASDLLQSNGIIWVEGPSDRNYINKWISLIDPALVEGNHYSIMFYGGKLLSQVNFDEVFFNKELIPLLKINRNAFVVIDKDAKKLTSAISETKTRIQNEIGANSCWITEGREIENYLTKAVLLKWLSKNEFSINEEDLKLEKFENVNDSISRICSIDYSKAKVKYSSEIADLVSINDLKNHDLETRTKELVTHIRIWNKMSS